MRTINWGIIGLGKIAHKFAQDLSTLEQTKLHAVASRSQEKANDFAKTYGAAVAYGSYEKLAKDPTIDAVYIATPHSFHKEHSVLCLKQKKAVLCEKPFAMNQQEVEDMVSCAQANDTLLMEALWTYFLPHYQFVLKTIESNTFGKLLKLKADFGFKAALHPEGRLYKKALGGGSLLDIGIYPIFAALSSLGYPKVISSEATFFDNGADASCNIHFGYSDEVEAVLHSTLEEETATTATFEFEDATLILNSRFHEPTSVSIIQNGKEDTKTFDYKTIGYSYEIEHFNQLISDGKKESPIMTFDFSRQLISLLDAVRSQIGLDYD